MKKRQMSLGALVLPLATCLFSCQPGKGSTVDPLLNPIGLEEGDGDLGISSTPNNEGGSLHYEIFVRSFCDSDGDGIGDFNGVASKADYLQSLGIGEVWLMPINPSPSYHGYDVSDYYSVNPDYGTMEEFESMVDTLNDHGIRVTIDMVLNHSAITNPWFNQSCTDYSDGYAGADSKADWYMWSDTKVDGNYQSYLGKYYLGAFSPSMPDFNWDSPSLRAEMKKILQFWIGKGVQGYRLDAVRYYYEENVSKNIEALNYIAECCHEVDPDFYIVGENWGNGLDYLDYYSSDIDSFFNFNTSIAYSSGVTIVSSAKLLNSGDSYVATVANSQKAVKEKNPSSYNSFFIANHDTDRASKSLYGDYAKVGAAIVYLLPGTPYIYYGEEIELWGVRGSESTDAMRRLPMVWGEGHEEEECDFPDKTASYLSYQAEQNQVKEGVYDQLEDPFSLLNVYRRIAEVRNSYPFIRDAEMKAISTKTRNFFAYELIGEQEGEDIVIVINGDDVATELNLSEYSSFSLDNEVQTMGLKASWEGGTLGLGGYSVAVLRK